MSQTSTSLDLSEFFNNDDSDGHRLAEFLQKRRGGVQRQNFLFMNCEPDRLSLNVQLEKLENCNTKQQTNNDHQETESVEKEVASLKVDNEEALPPTSPKNVQNEEPTSSNARDLQSKPVSPISPPARPQSPSSVETPPKSETRPKALSPIPRPLSPRLSSIRKSGGAISPGDRLRRYSLKRLTRMSAGRRTLLQEFESTVTDADFEPPVCSTPLSQPITDNPTSTSPTTRQSAETQLSSMEKSPALNESCCGHTDTLIRTLKRKDEELKNYMENMLENTLKKIQTQEKENQNVTSSHRTLKDTKSPLKRTYTVEKGSTPGQVILTPDKGNTEHSPCHSKQVSPSKKLKTSEQNLTRSMISIRVKSPQNRIASQQLDINQSKENQSNATNESAKMLERSRREINVPNTPPTTNSPAAAQNNISIVLPSQDIEIPETQDLVTAKNNSIIIQSSNVGEMPVVVIPVNQHFNRTYGDEISKNNTIIKAKAKKTVSPTQIQQAANTNASVRDACLQLEDNLKLTDILTDDEDETPKAAVSKSIENNSQAPLNLAPSATNLRTKRLKKRSISRRRLQMDNSQLLSTETEAEPAPPAHSSRRMVKKKRIPLNRAPGTPLNGEKFAEELARMSNYEILDLRKRNSLGRVFAISGRKSTRAQEEAVKRQHKLGDQIEMELQRRNINDALDQEQQHEQNDQTNENVALIDEFLPVPDDFRDSSTKQTAEENSLIDEKSTDRVTFKNKRKSSIKHLKRRSKTKEQSVPEVLKQYLEVSKMVSQNKNKNLFNKSKRSLYTQGQSDTEDQDSPEKANENQTNKTSRILRNSIPYLPSPPKSDSEKITAVKVVSPPPPLIITPRKSIHDKQNSEKTLPTTVVVNNTEDVLPPPPAGFESDSGVSSNNNLLIDHHTSITNTNKKHNTMASDTHLKRNSIHGNNGNKTDDENDNIFKKPLRPAPKRRGRKPKSSKAVSNDVELQGTATAGSDSQQSGDENDGSAADTTDSSLRRSKRGQVPLKHNLSLFQMLYQQSFNKRMKNVEKQMKKGRIMSKNKETTTNENQSITSTKKTTKVVKEQTQLPPVAEDGKCITALREDIQILKKKPPNIKESKVKRKQNKKNKQNEDFECSRITMITPPPVDHLNNVFDQLKNSTICHNNTSPLTNESPSSSAPPRPPSSSSTSTTVQKVKPFKVRVARLKNTTRDDGNKQIAVNACSSTTTNYSTNSNNELFSWLLHMSTSSENSTPRNDEIFKEMRISSASNLSFTEIQGIEYAFYDTTEKASLGYLRFKPRQIKEKKKTKRFHLHFVTLVGEFRITANDREKRVGVGDMVVIEKAVYYDIENLTDEFGIIMVIKK